MSPPLPVAYSYIRIPEDFTPSLNFSVTSAIFGALLTKTLGQKKNNYGTDQEKRGHFFTWTCLVTARVENETFSRLFIFKLEIKYLVFAFLNIFQMQKQQRAFYFKNLLANYVSFACCLFLLGS